MGKAEKNLPDAIIVEKEIFVKLNMFKASDFLQTRNFKNPFLNLLQYTVILIHL